MRVADASFVVVDTETTGHRAAHDRLIEIGALKISGGRVIDRFEALINPKCSVPRRITRLTGISTAMVFDQPVAAHVLPKFVDFLDDGILVAHNLAFDAGFLNEERRRTGPGELPNATLCTLRLARRLLPGLRSKSLSALTDFYGIRVRRRHRALADAEAAGEVLLRLLDHLDLEFGVGSVADVLAFQYRRYSAIRRQAANVARIRDEVLDALPAAPGVYFMKDGRGRTLYVGKAQDLSARVRSYFTAVEGHTSHIRKLVRSVRDVEWEETDSDLDALILESRLIKKLQPPYNRAQRRYRNRPFIRIGTSHPFPRISWSAFLHDDGDEYYGPLANREEAAFLVELIDRFFQLRECDEELFARGRQCVYASIGRCSAPCEGDETSAYRAELDRVRAFLSGRDGEIADRIREAMQQASTELNYEQAAVYRDWLSRLDRILKKRGAVASRVLDHNAVVVHRPDAASPRMLLVSRGRHVGTIRVGSDHTEATETLKRILRMHIDSEPTLDVYREREIDEIYLLSHWLYVHRHETRQVFWSREESPEEIAERMGGLLARECGRSPSGTCSAAAVLTEPN